VAGILVVLLAPVLLVGLACAMIRLRTSWGGCPTHRRYAWLLSSAPTRAMVSTGQGSVGRGQGSFGGRLG
jgi:hypothetical protein